MQQPPPGQDWPQQGQPPYGYGQPSQLLPSNTQWGQQPPSPYPPQQGQWQQPFGQPPPVPDWQPQQPPKKSRKGLWIVLGIVAAVVVFGCIGISAVVSQTSKNVNTAVNNAQSTVDTSLTQLPTSTPTQATSQPTSGGKWTTIQTFTGNGTKKTAIFSVPGDWKIVYSCNGMIAGTATDGLLAVSVYDSNSTPIDPAAVNATCKSGSKLTKGETEEHQSGSIYLDINGTGDWTVQIQELK